MSTQDTTRAITALEGRLRAWGVDQPAGKAREYVTDLIDWGWQMAPEREMRPHPPKAEEQCPTHPGSHANACRGCRADQLAGEPPPQRGVCGVCGKASDHALHANDHPFERLHEGAATVRVDELRAALRGTA